MLRAHHMARTYGQRPSQVLGLEQGTWPAFIVDCAAWHIGDSNGQSMIKRAGGAMPVVVVGHG